MNFAPHRTCLLNQEWLIEWLNITNSLIAISYFVIPAVLIILLFFRVKNFRRSMWVILGISAGFIVTCGMTHIMEIVTLYKPWYVWSAVVSTACALFSVPAAVIYIKALRFAFTFRYPILTIAENVNLQRHYDRLQAIKHQIVKHRSSSLIVSELIRMRDEVYDEILATQSRIQNLMTQGQPAFSKDAEFILPTELVSS